MATPFYCDQLNQVKERQAVLNIVHATDQFRLVLCGNVRKFQAIGLRHKNNKWQVQDTDGKWYTSFWCEA